MSQQVAEIEQWAIQELGQVVPAAFAGATIERQGWMSTLRWLCPPVALELELDFRELDICCLLVRLDDGELPDGYYVAAGSRCRIHLLKLIRDRQWSADQAAIDQLLDDRRRTPRAKGVGVEALKQRISLYKAILASCLPDIIADADAIWADANIES